MIDLYHWAPPDGHEAAMFPEEAGPPSTIQPIDIGRGAPFQPDFLEIAPNTRIPALLDTSLRAATMAACGRAGGINQQPTMSERAETVMFGHTAAGTRR